MPSNDPYIGKLNKVKAYSFSSTRRSGTGDQPAGPEVSDIAADIEVT